jgi:hypothetical protein
MSENIELKDVAKGDKEAIKKKVKTLYAKITRKYPNDPPLIPPWKDDGKRKHTMPEKKDFTTLFQTAQAADALEDWGDLINTLTQAMMQAFCMGDEPQSDMKDALDQFSEAVLAWCECAVQCGMDDYLSDQGYSSNNTPYVPYSLRMGSMGYMSRDAGNMATKKGAAFSQASKDAIGEQVKALQNMADQHQNMSDKLAEQYKSAKAFHGQMQEKAKGIANDLENLYTEEGQNPPYTEDGQTEQKPNDNKPGKSRQPATPPAQQAPDRQAKATNPPLTPSTDTSLEELEALLLAS